MVRKKGFGLADGRKKNSLKEVPVKQSQFIEKGQKTAGDWFRNGEGGKGEGVGGSKRKILLSRQRPRECPGSVAAGE